jgi:hypothetical protein
MYMYTYVDNLDKVRRDFRRTHRASLFNSFRRLVISLSYFLFFYFFLFFFLSFFSFNAVGILSESRKKKNEAQIKHEISCVEPRHSGLATWRIISKKDKRVALTCCFFVRNIFLNF